VESRSSAGRRNPAVPYANVVIGGLDGSSEPSALGGGCAFDAARNAATSIALLGWWWDRRRARASGDPRSRRRNLTMKVSSACVAVERAKFDK
jgi:hypothetical protein